MNNFYKKIDKKNSFTLNITVVLLVLLLTSALIFIGKTILDILELNQLIYQKRLELEIKYKQGMSLKKTNQEIEQSKIRLDNISKIILNTENTLDFIDDLEKTAENNNLKHLITLPNFEKPKTPTPINISITLNGSYINTLKFIENLHYKPYNININKISFNQQTDEVITSIEANIYWQ